MNRKVHKYCAVPKCGNTSKKHPKKIFVYVPNEKTLRDRWLILAHRDPTYISPKTPIYFCEDHFDLPNDMENYVRYLVMGSISQVRMKPGCVPTKFDCLSGRRKQGSYTVEQLYGPKRRRRNPIEEYEILDEKTQVFNYLELGENSSGSSASHLLEEDLRESYMRVAEASMQDNRMVKFPTKVASTVKASRLEYACAACYRAATREAQKDEQYESIKKLLLQEKEILKVEAFKVPLPPISPVNRNILDIAVEEDTQNYIKYKIITLQEKQKTTLRLKKGILPHKFLCQRDTKLQPPSERKGYLKRKHLEIIGDALSMPLSKQSVSALKIIESSQNNCLEAGTSSSSSYVPTEDTENKNLCEAGCSTSIPNVYNKNIMHVNKAILATPKVASGKDTLARNDKIKKRRKRRYGGTKFSRKKAHAMAPVPSTSKGPSETLNNVRSRTWVPIIEPSLEFTDHSYCLPQFQDPNMKAKSEWDDEETTSCPGSDTPADLIDLDPKSEPAMSEQDEFESAAYEQDDFNTAPSEQDQYNSAEYVQDEFKPAVCGQDEFKPAVYEQVEFKTEACEQNGFDSAGHEQDELNSGACEQNEFNSEGCEQDQCKSEETEQPNNWCCCCMVTLSNVPLFSMCAEQGLAVMYSDLLQECYNVNISKSMRAVATICVGCTQRLKDAVRFKRRVLLSHRALKHLYETDISVKEEPSESEDEKIDETAIITLYTHKPKETQKNTTPQSYQENVSPERSDVTLPSFKSNTKDPETSKNYPENDIFNTGCGCTRDCPKQFQRENITSFRSKCKKLDIHCASNENHLDIFLLGALTCLLKNVSTLPPYDLTLNYRFKDISVCKDFFLFTFNVSKQRCTSILEQLASQDTFSDGESVFSFPAVVPKAYNYEEIDIKEEAIW